MLNPNQIVVLNNELEVAKVVAQLIFEKMSQSFAAGKSFVLGCPGGRTPRQTYLELGHLIGQAQLSISQLWIVMMDDYVELQTDQYQNVDDSAHYSCRKFAVKEIFDVLNQNLPTTKQIPITQVITPDAADPAKYEAKIAELGIDLFILASGASDGHIAFNGPGTEKISRTRIVTLADSTRSDNLKTFPEFNSIADVPKFGVTIGPASIKEYSKQVVMLLLGEAKAEAFKNITSAATYESSWPATITVECNNPLLFADRAAAKL